MWTGPAHELRAVTDCHLQPVVVHRDFEAMEGERDNFRIELYGVYAYLVHVVMHELCDRAAAQPHHQHIARLGEKQQKSHHAARVRELEVVRTRKPHGALYGVAADVQRAHAEFFADVNGLRVIGGLAYAPLRPEFHFSLTIKTAR